MKSTHNNGKIYTGRICKWKCSASIYFVLFLFLFLKFVIASFSCRKTQKTKHMFTCLSPSLAQCTGKPSCSTCPLARYYVRLSMLTKCLFVVVGFNHSLLVYRWFTLGERTGRPISETHPACGWCPSCSTDVWSGSACHSS